MSDDVGDRALLRGASQRLIRTVDALEDGAWTGPTLCPGWTRAHLVAHLALNAEALTGVLRGVKEGHLVPMYPSQEARDADIETLCKSSPSELRDRLLGGITDMADAISVLPAELAPTRVERVPGGPMFSAGAVVGMRLREVEIHHADLDRGYSHSDWPEEFVVHLLNNRSRAYAGDTGFAAYATDLDHSWQFGEAGPTVSGPGSALAWWTTGRDSGGALSSDDGPLPAIPGW